MERHTLGGSGLSVSSGRVRHAGACNYSGEQTALAAEPQRAQGAAPLASVQVEYSLLERGPERDVVPAALAGQLGLLAWAPLGRAC
jgi:aryl-alcohol dehydrogenase-like predicted oxidoreductase